MGIASALVVGLRGDPVPCPTCQGNGGIRCIICEGSGRVARRADDTMSARPPPRQKRDVLGLAARDPLECRACKGIGLILCKVGSGAQSGAESDAH